jgi:hypothetical protein
MLIAGLARKHAAVSDIRAFLAFYASYLVKDLHKPEMKRLLRTVRPYSMVSYERLRRLYELAESAEVNRLEGAFVECGVWRGGCSGVMAYLANKYGSGREVHLFDSFEGLPDPTDRDGEEARSYMDRLRHGAYAGKFGCAVSADTVKSFLSDRLKISCEHVHIHQGWFKHTIPRQAAGIGDIALLHADADWYDSTKVCLDHLYDKVVPGGAVVFDDYGYWPGCKRAVDEFFAERRLATRLQRIDACGYYVIKPSASEDRSR